MSSYISSAMITAWCKDISQQQALYSFQQMNIKNIAIGNIEKTGNELEHFHIVVSFQHSVRFETIKNICNSFHIEKCKSSASITYALKEGVYYNDFDQELNNDNNIYVALINDMSILTWKEIIKKYPKLILNNYQNAFSMYRDINLKE